MHVSSVYLYVSVYFELGRLVLLPPKGDYEVSCKAGTSANTVMTKVGSHIHVVPAPNTLRPRQNGRRFPDDTFERIFLNEDVIILIKISLKFVPKDLINNIRALVQIMAWNRPGDKPLSEPMMVRLPTHICVTRPQ